MFRGFLVLLIFAFLTGSCNKGFNKILKSQDAEFKLRSADSLFNVKKYSQAQQLYEELFAVYKGSQKFEELYYKYAYSFYHQELYAQAEQMYKGFLEVFPNSKYAEEMSYMQAFMLYKQSPKVELEQVNTLKAMSALQSFIVNNPNSQYNVEAGKLIDELRAKLEAKEARSAKLYYDIGQYRAAAIAYDKVLISYPESGNAEDYKMKSIISYFKYAEMSLQEKQIERYEKVIEEYQDFMDRFPESKRTKEAEEYANNSKNKINNLRNEQIAQTIQQ